MKTSKKLLSASLLLVATGLLSCSTPPPECTIGQSSTSSIGFSGIAAFAVRYKLVSGTGECANLKGDVVGFQSYHPETAPGSVKRDFGKTNIAIRPQTVGELQWMIEDVAGVATEQFCTDGTDDDGDGKIDDKDEDCHYNGVGPFTSTDPDTSDMCHVDSLTQHIVFPGGTAVGDTGVECDPAAMDMGASACKDGGGDCSPNDPMDLTKKGECLVSQDFAPVDIQYDWSNIAVYVTAAATGTQFNADLKITLNGSTCSYKAIGMWPAVDCSGANGTDEALCNPEADPENGRPVGSGINPDFGPVQCDKDIATLPSIDDYHTKFLAPDGIYNHGAPLSVPRCAITSDTIPALEGFKK
jgi:hypothetical protein